MALTKNQKWMIVGGIAAIGLFVAYKKGLIFKKVEVAPDTASGANGAQMEWVRQNEMHNASGSPDPKVFTCKCANPAIPPKEMSNPSLCGSYCAGGYMATNKGTGSNRR